jgi:phage/plasmid-like protein (TIGR03299 family)
MSAEVETMAYVGDRGLPWWVGIEAGKANEMAGLATAEEILAASETGWTVERKPIRVVGGAVITDRVANVRSTDGKPLGVVGTGYTIVQNDTAARFASQLIDTGEALFETGGSLRGGKQVFYSMELPKAEVQVPGDDSATKMYLLVTNGHDGGHAFEAAVTPVRVVCVNTLNMGLASATSRWKIYHRSGLDGRLAVAKQALGITHKYALRFAEVAGQLALKKVVDQQVADIFASKVWPVPDDLSAWQLAEHASSRAFETYMTSDTLGAIRGTAWGAVNAVAEFLDHEVEYGSRNGNPADARAASILWGTAHDKKEAALAAFTKL